MRTGSSRSSCLTGSRSSIRRTDSGGGGRIGGDMHVHRTGSCSTLGDMTGIGSGSGDMASGVTRAAGDVFGGGSAASATSAGRGASREVARHGGGDADGGGEERSMAVAWHSLEATPLTDTVTGKQVGAGRARPF